MLTGEQEEDLEHLQHQALKCIYGYTESYRTLKERTGLVSLKERREAAVLKFAEKSLEGGYSSWFPLREGREVRNKMKYRDQ
jgi:hypothetical protein